MTSDRSGKLGSVYGCPMGCVYALVAVLAVLTLGWDLTGSIATLIVFASILIDAMRRDEYVWWLSVRHCVRRQEKPVLFWAIALVNAMLLIAVGWALIGKLKA